MASNSNISETAAANDETDLQKIEEGGGSSTSGITDIEANCSLNRICTCPAVVTITQKLVAELVGTYFIIFAGCGSVVVNKTYEGSPVTFPGICVTWGLIVMVMIYTVGHVSGAHFNPAVSITFFVFGRFPLKELPLYIIAQCLGSLLASGTLVLMFHVTSDSFFGTVPSGSTIQSFVIEIVISFLLMFVVCGVGTDNRALGQSGGTVIGMTIMLNVLVAGQVTGASMNPARSIGPAIVRHTYDGIWAYIFGPIIGTLSGAFVYNMLRTVPIVSTRAASSAIHDA